MARIGKVEDSTEKTKLEDWWTVPKSTNLVGYRVPVDAHDVSRASAGNTSTIVLPEDLVGRVVAWSATISTRRGVEWVPIETLGSHLGPVAEESGIRSQQLRVRWRGNPDVSDIQPEKDGLVCSLLLAVR
jgi:hypothetical protein